MTQARATAAEVMRSEVRNSGVPGRSLHHMPNGLGRDVVPPDRAVSADSAKDEAGRNSGGVRPGIHRLFDPTRHRNRSDAELGDRKSTRLNSSHLGISYAV